MWKAVVLAAALAMPEFAAVPERMEPVDQLADDAELASVVAALLKACDEKDFRPFEAVMLPDLIVSYAGFEGIEDLRRIHRLDEPDTGFWDEFRTIIRLGGVFDGKDRFEAPYVSALWPEAEHDGSDVVVAVGNHTALYATPADGAQVIADVTHRVLAWDEDRAAEPDGPPCGWTRVKHEGRVGYVKWSESRSPIDYRVVFERIDGRWRITQFVGGN